MCVCVCERESVRDLHVNGNVPLVIEVRVQVQVMTLTTKTCYLRTRIHAHASTYALAHTHTHACTHIHTHTHINPSRSLTHMHTPYSTQQTSRMSLGVQYCCGVLSGPGTKQSSPLGPGIRSGSSATTQTPFSLQTTPSGTANASMSAESFALASVSVPRCDCILQTETQVNRVQLEGVSDRCTLLKLSRHLFAETGHWSSFLRASGGCASFKRYFKKDKLFTRRAT